MEIKEKKFSKKDRLFILPAFTTGIGLLLLILFLWPKVKEYNRIKTDYERERTAVNDISGRWDEILQKEKYYREIYANLQQISQHIGKSQTELDYMKIFINRTRLNRVKIISFSQSSEKTLDTTREITFRLNISGHYKAIGNYLKYLESAYPIVNIQSLSMMPKLAGFEKNIQLNVQISGKIIFLI